jgi:hypothetical protein
MTLAIGDYILPSMIYTIRLRFLEKLDGQQSYKDVAEWQLEIIQ